MYCTASDVRSIIHTGLTDSEIETIIELSDAEIDKRLGSQDSSDKVIKKLSMLLTARTVKLRQPGSVAVGEYSESSEHFSQVVEAEIEKTWRLYSGVTVSSSSYGIIDEDDRSVA
ncbi:hypothetical protein KAT55_06625 [Candidatus Bathyarchaeota archaeon]|nr:hypothetical protein [Candidatus Bathyarchaeota archaeon]